MIMQTMDQEIEELKLFFEEKLSTLDNQRYVLVVVRRLYKSNKRRNI